MGNSAKKIAAAGAYRRGPREGVTLLLVILVISTILAIAIGIFNAVYSQLQLVDEIEGSFSALYAADETMERAFYCDRTPSARCTPCPDGSASCTITGSNSNACTILAIDRRGRTTTMTATGEYRCNYGDRATRRAFEASYTD